MAITEDSVYSGAYEPNYAQPIGFYFNSAACTNAAETIVDDAMDANADTLCTITCSINEAGAGERFEFVISVDGTSIMARQVDGNADVGDGSEKIELLIPAGKNLKVTGDNQGSGTSVQLSVYVIIKPLAGTSTT